MQLGLKNERLAEKHWFQFIQSAADGKFPAPPKIESWYRLRLPLTGDNPPPRSLRSAGERDLSRGGSLKVSSPRYDKR
uniref:Uncharacterized protein n=1 Tax=Romanomermis culicivorax TaxID=13658 RepID=A0A915L8K5_ROMCU